MVRSVRQLRPKPAIGLDLRDLRDLRFHFLLVVTRLAATVIWLN